MDKDMESVLVGCTIYIFLVSMTFSFCVKLQNWTITDIMPLLYVQNLPPKKALHFSITLLQEADSG